MKYLLILFLLSFDLFAIELKKYESEIVPQRMSVKEKKKRFYALVQPAVQKVYKELLQQYKSVSKDIQTNKNQIIIQKLKKYYKVSSDEKLLLALKPHPQSVTLAQAAMESSWATSRFFVEAKNVFGMWSVNPNEQRIAAMEKRGGTKTIWLKKFNTIEDSIRAYYKLMGRAKAYKEFRKVRYMTNNPLKIIIKLDKYSEMGIEYTKALARIIRYNKLQKFDI